MDLLFWKEKKEAKIDIAICYIKLIVKVFDLDICDIMIFELDVINYSFVTR